MVGMTLFHADHISVSHVRDGRAVPLFHDACLRLEGGLIYDLTGASGSGKSTLLRACALMIARDAGSLYLQGRSSDGFGPQEWRRQVCLVPQQPALVAGTVRDNLVLPWCLKVNAASQPPSDGELARLLCLAGLEEVELSRDASRLSGGQQARVALLRSFATKPKVFLLDEVDAALDSASSQAISRLTRDYVGSDATCLRIRHRSADGYAAGTYTLEDGALSYVAAGRGGRS